MTEPMNAQFYTKLARAEMSFATLQAPIVGALQRGRALARAEITP